MSETTETNTYLIKCFQCGGIVSKEATTCPHCGGSPTKEAYDKKKKQKNSNLILIIVLLICSANHLQKKLTIRRKNKKIVI